MKKNSFICFLATILISFSALGHAEIFSRVYCDQVVDRIRPMLNGVSQGGDTCSYLKPECVKAVKPLGLKFVRLEAVTGNHFYNLYDPKTKQYHWDELDREIENIQSTGAEIIADIFYMPKWLSSDPDEKKGNFRMTTPSDYEAWVKYVSDIVRHVNLEKKYKVKYWEIWNEPSGIWAFEPWKYGRESFFHLYEVTAKAIKKTDPSALVGGFGDNANYPEHYMAFFGFAQSRHLPIDFVTIHWYAEWKPDGWKQPELYYFLPIAIKNLYRTYFKHDAPLFITEWNMNAERPDQTEAQQSAFIGQSLFWMQQGPADGANFFRVEYYKMDRAVLNPQYQIRSPGRILQMFGRLPMSRLNVCDDAAGIKILAAGDKKKIAAMISRYDSDKSATKTTLKLSFTGHGYRGLLSVKVYLENRDRASIAGPMEPFSTNTVNVKTDTPIIVPVELEPYSVAMIEIVPLSSR